MAKKIYDIYPPDIEKEDRLYAPPGRKLMVKKEISFFLKSGNSSRKLGIIFLAAALLSIAAALLFFDKMEIHVWPRTEKEEMAGSMEIKTSALRPDAGEKVIPGEIFEIEKSEKRTFLSSGKEIEEKKAEGYLTVYNNYSSLPQILVAETRFISADGKLFHSFERVTVPGRKQEGGRTVPGEVNVRVRAAEPGEGYNIERKSKFSIPGLQGTPMYTAIYAENPDPIAGGYIGELPKITENDIVEARDILISDISKKAKEELQKKISGDFVFSDELIERSVLEEFVSPGAGENSESFEYNIRLNLKILSFKTSHLEEVAEILLESGFQQEEQVPDLLPQRKIHRESMKINYEVVLKNFAEEEARLDIEISALSYWSPDDGLLKDALSGKSVEEARRILEDHREIADLRIRKPFWMKNIPRRDKIRLIIKIEE